MNLIKDEVRISGVYPHLRNKGSRNLNRTVFHEFCIFLQGLLMESYNVKDVADFKKQSSS